MEDFDGKGPGTLDVASRKQRLAGLLQQRSSSIQTGLGFSEAFNAVENSFHPRETCESNARRLLPPYQSLINLKHYALS